MEPELGYDTPEMISYLSWFTGKEENLRKQQELRQREREQMNSARNITIKVTLSWPVSEGFSHFHVHLCSVISRTYLLQDPKVRRRVRGLGKSHHGRNNPKTKWLKVHYFCVYKCNQMSNSFIIFITCWGVVHPHKLYVLPQLLCLPRNISSAILNTL